MDILSTYDKLGPSECLELVVNNLKNNVPVWEELIAKTTKLNASIKTTLISSASFLESFQKVADLATSSPSGLKDLGAMLTRFCIRQKGVEGKIKTFNNQLVDSLGSPLQDRVEDWKRVNNQFDREKQKDWRRARTELHKADQETQKLKKKSERKNSSTGPDTRLQLEFAQQDLFEKQQVLADMERMAMRRALIEDRRRFAEFVACVKPVLDSQLNLLNEVATLEELINQVYAASTDPSQLPPEAEHLLDQFDPNFIDNKIKTPPSSVSSSINSGTISRKQQPVPAPTTPQSQRSTRSSNSSCHSSSTASNSGCQQMGYPVMGTKVNNRIASISSQDSAYNSQDPSKPPDSLSNGFDKLSRQNSNESNKDQKVYDTLNDTKHKQIDEDEDEDEDDLSCTSDSEDEGSTTPSSLPDNNQDSTSKNTVIYPNGFTSLRRHTISAGASERPGLTSNTFKPANSGGANSTRRQSLYPNQAIPPPIYANMTQLENAARRNYGRQMDQDEEQTGNNNINDSQHSETTNQALSMIEALTASPQGDTSQNPTKNKKGLPVPEIDDLSSWIAYPPAPKGWEDPPDKEREERSMQRNPLSTYATISRKSRRQDLSGWFQDNKSSSFSPKEIPLPPQPITPPIRKPASPPTSTFSPKSSQSSPSPLSSSFSSPNQSQYDTPSFYPAGSGDVYATNINIGQTQVPPNTNTGYLNQSELRSFYRSISADQSNSTNERGPVKSHKQGRSGTLVRRSSSTSRAPGSAYSVPDTMVNNPDMSQGNFTPPLHDQLGVRVRCTSASSRPALPPKPRMSMYASPGDIAINQKSMNTARQFSEPGASHGVSRRAEKVNSDDVRRRRRSEACTSFVGGNSAVDIDIDGPCSIPTIYAHDVPSTMHTTGYLDEIYASHHQQPATTHPHKRQASYTPGDAALKQQPICGSSAPMPPHLSQLKQRHRQEGRAPCSPASVKKRQNSVDPLVAALKQGVTLRKTGQSGDHQSMYSGMPHQV